MKHERDSIKVVCVVIFTTSTNGILTRGTFDSYRASFLIGITADTKPNDLVRALGDDLLARFKDMPLLDEYDVYQQLMSYWNLYSRANYGA